MHQQQQVVEGTWINESHASVLLWSDACEVT
jgi:hypothetical protein